MSKSNPNNSSPKYSSQELRLESNPKAAKVGFEEIIDILKDPELAKEGSGAISKEISKARSGIRDTALQVFANSTQALLTLPDSLARTKGLQNLQEEFRFLENENPRTIEEMVHLTAKAVRESHEASTDDSTVSNAIYSGFTAGVKQFLRQEEIDKLDRERKEKDWGETKSIISDGVFLSGKLGIAFTMALLIPPPFGLIAGAAFAYYAISNRQSEEIDQEASFPEAWKKFAEPELRRKQSVEGAEKEQKKELEQKEPKQKEGQEQGREGQEQEEKSKKKTAEQLVQTDISNPDTNSSKKGKSPKYYVDSDGVAHNDLDDNHGLVGGGSDPLHNNDPLFVEVGEDELQKEEPTDKKEEEDKIVSRRYNEYGELIGWDDDEGVEDIIIPEEAKKVARDLIKEDVLSFGRAASTTGSSDGGRENGGGTSR